MPGRRRRFDHLVGESLREVGVLFAALAPVDGFLVPHPNLRIILSFIAGGFAFIFVGLIIETRS